MDRDSPVGRTRLGRAGTAIFNLLFWPYLLATLPLWFMPSIVLFVLTFRDRRRVLLKRYTNLWSSHYLVWAPFAGCRVEGRHRLDGLGPCIYVSNHQSLVDILAVGAARLVFLWVSKIENFWVPFLGWNMFLCGDVRLERGYLPSILRMVRECDALLKDGIDLFVFPEGTRSPDGEIKSFHRGAFWMAARNRVPVVPILIEGTDRVLPKKRLAISPAPCLVRILDPMDPADYAYDDRELRDAVRERLVRERATLRGARD